MIGTVNHVVVIRVTSPLIALIHAILPVSIAYLYIMKVKNFLKYLVVFLGFVAAYVAYFYLYRLDLQVDYLQATNEVPSLRYFGSNAIDRMMNISESWGALAGLAVGLLSFVVSMILFGLLKAIKVAKIAWTHAIAMLLVYGVWLAFAVELIYFENRYSAIAIGVIMFVGRPLLVASVFALLLVVVLLLLPSLIRLVRNNKKEAKLATVLLAALVFLPGCSLLAQIQELACIGSTDEVHCPQEAAVASGDPDKCDKVKPPEGYTSSNPPRDKCYMMVAQNTGDLSTCDRIEGGIGSYSKEECILSTAVENENATGCQMLTGTSKQQCINKVGPKITPTKVMDVDKQIELVKKELEKGADEGLQKQLSGLEKMRDDMVATMTPYNKESYERLSDPVNQDIIGDWVSGEINDKTKKELIELNNKLREREVQMTKEQYEKIKAALNIRNNPEYDIEQMTPKEILKKGIGEQAGELVDKLKFWRMNDTVKEKKLDQQLRFYQKMLERQKAVNQGLSKADQDFWEVTDKVLGEAGDKISEEIKNKIIEETFGDMFESSAAGPTAAILGEAIDEVKRNAKSAEFRGLVKIYNEAMEEELVGHGGDVDAAHKAVVKNLTADPDRYSYDHTFEQPTNLLKNKDCDGSNPEHCLHKDVFWKAMKKSYKYQNPGK